MDASLVAAALSLGVDDIEQRNHTPRVAGVGLPFLLVELASLDALQRARIGAEGFESLRATGVAPLVHMYVHSGDEFDIRARMFAPFDGVPEDPATGSANCALAAFLTHLSGRETGEASWRIAQGVEMGRPSVLEARTRIRDGEIETLIGGYSVLVSEGWLTVA